MLTPYFPPIILPLFVVIEPFLTRFAPAFKPIILGAVALVAMIACAFLTPLTAVEVPAQVVILFELLAAGYTAAKVVEAKVEVKAGPTGATPVLAFLASLGLIGAGVVYAQDTLPPTGAGPDAWAAWGFALVYGLVSRLLARRKKEGK